MDERSFKEKITWVIASRRQTGFELPAYSKRYRVRFLYHPPHFKIMKTDQELLDKWKRVVNFSSGYLEDTPTELKLYVSQKLEEYEDMCFRWGDEGKIKDNSKFPKCFIPQVRATLGNPIITYDVMINGRLGLVVENGKCWDKYQGRVGIHYEPEDIHCHTSPMGVYKWVDEKWEYC